MTEKERRALERSLPVKLTTEELLHRSRELATNISAVASERAAASEAAKRSKAKVAELKKRAGELVEQLRSGAEDRLVDCEEVLDHGRHCAEVLRLDTGEIVDFRPLRPEENQTKLIPLDGGLDVSVTLGTIPPARPGKPEGGE